ncbi:sigma 54-interacting transcriptional regulator [Shewanella sp. C32]|uniref:Sigma 54-interacting transcriptional regulator n=1 Tax=Shewanella electrica TaxID=515560 RepID=A0ABT2FF93_9GAMM|nr:sigma 54-interacting transcriptional regulator [Shewanella electrica]MCH1925114.1 sigma 54-interacting transcriptional regulator [Shewanella electrica]MCS4554938.1 sigma 54-interacting transcriptional regulator [Shewanella electrica]
MTQRLEYLHEQKNCLRLTHQLLDQSNVAQLLQSMNAYLRESPVSYQCTMLVDDPVDGPLLYRQHQDEVQCISDEMLLNGPLRLIEATRAPLHLCADEYQQRYPALYSLTKAPAFCDALILPILNHRRLLGYCELRRADGHRFDSEDVACAELLSESLGVALEHLQARLSLGLEQHQLCEERDDFHVLVNVTNAVITERSVESLVEKIAHEIHVYFGICAVSVCLPDTDPSLLNLYNAFFTEPAQPQRSHLRITAANSICQRVLEHGEIELCELTADDPFARNETQLFQYWPAERHTLCLVPIKFAGQVLGVLKLARADAHCFQGSRLQLLAQIAERTAIAVDNARAYQEINRLKDNLMRENHYLSEQVESLSHQQFDEIIGSSHSIQAVLKQVELVASTDCSVLLLGETGTGKEVFARAIHRLSPRAHKRMVKMNCAAMPAGLLESDLFGHEKGAFTGASKDRQGRFEMAHHSSLFLDEVGDMPLELQPKLLRVLQEQEFERVGGNRLINVDVRLIAATNRNLQKMVVDKEFRSDLFYRLNVFPIRLPSLNERRDDIPLLTKFFVSRACQHMGRNIDSIPTRVLRRLQELEWPGNIRELQNVIERAVLLSSGHTLQLPPEIETADDSEASFFHVTASPLAAPKRNSDEDDEYQRIVSVLQETNGIVAGPRGAAHKLGLKRTTLLSRMKRLGIDKDAVLE